LDAKKKEEKGKMIQLRVTNGEWRMAADEHSPLAVRHLTLV
jgi:hypothetical protein